MAPWSEAAKNLSSGPRQSIIDRGRLRVGDVREIDTGIEAGEFVVYAWQVMGRSDLGDRETHYIVEDEGNGYFSCNCGPHNKMSNRKLCSHITAVKHVRGDYD